VCLLFQLSELMHASSGCVVSSPQLHSDGDRERERRREKGTVHSLSRNIQCWANTEQSPSLLHLFHLPCEAKLSWQSATGFGISRRKTRLQKKRHVIKHNLLTPSISKVLSLLFLPARQRESSAQA